MDDSGEQKSSTLGKEPKLNDRIEQIYCQVTAIESALFNSPHANEGPAAETTALKAVTNSLADIADRLRRVREELNIL